MWQRGAATFPRGCKMWLKVASPQAGQSQVACHCHKLCNFCARLNHFLGVYGKNEDYHPLRFFVLFVVVYFVFSVDAFFMEKIVKQNRLFLAFFKKAKTCLMEMALAPSFFMLWGF